MTLKPKQERFCQEYIIDLNATQAAIRAGYSKKTANANVTRLMVNDGIQDRIAELTAKQNKRTEIDADFVLKELAGVVKNSKKLIPVVIGGKKTKKRIYANAAAVNKALELLGRHFGMFTDKAELTGKNGDPLIKERELITRAMTPDQARAAFEKSVRS